MAGTHPSLLSFAIARCFPALLTCPSRPASEWGKTLRRGPRQSQARTLVLVGCHVNDAVRIIEDVIEVFEKIVAQQHVVGRKSPFARFLSGVGDRPDREALDVPAPGKNL